MKKAKEIEADFRKDFEALLKKHNAEIEITDDGAPYGMHTGVAVITIAPKSYDVPEDKIDEFCEFNL